MDIVKKLIQIRCRKIFLVLICTTVVPSCWCIEEYQREIFLGPRNYNPHPYEHQFARMQDPGPVTFPREEDENDSNIPNRYNIITVNSNRNKHPVDNHPYSKVKQKIKNLISTKYNNIRDNQIDPGVYDALAEQGSKVLSYSPEDLKTYGDNSAAKKNYAFAYKVLDKGSGDDFSHQQIRNSKATNGEYRVKLPDGRVQTVSYKADNDGYHADVKYEDDPAFTQHNVISTSDVQNIHQYSPQNVEVQKIPVRNLKQRNRPALINRYDYAAGEEEQQLVSPITGPNVILEQAGPTQIPVKYVDVAVSPSPSPTAYLLAEAENYASPVPQHFPKVQIYTTNARDHFSGNYIYSTVATPVQQKGVIRYTSTPVPPVKASVEHTGDNGIYIPIIGSTLAPIVQSALGNLKNNIIRPDASGRIGGSEHHQTLAQENELPEGIYIVGSTKKK